MPVACVTLWSELGVSDPELISLVQSVVSDRLSTRGKQLTPPQVSVRISEGRGHALAPAEIEVFGHAFLWRLRRKDQRSFRIACDLQEATSTEWACWMNLCLVGFARSS